MLAQASAIIRSHCGWDIWPADDVDLTVDGSGAAILFLPSLLITEITSMVEDGIELEEGVDYEWSAVGFAKRIGASWTSSLRGVAVEITHGYEEAPEDVRSVCLGAASRAVSSPAGVKQEASSGVSVTYAVPGGLNDYELAVLESYQIRGGV